jgi:integrase
LRHTTARWIGWAFVCANGAGNYHALVPPHDLRRTYARRLYEGGVDLVAISQNLGHASTRTTLLYIGELGANKRRAPGVYSFNLAVLNEVGVDRRSDAEPAAG